MNTYQCSDGTRLKKSVIDARVRKAKQRKLDKMLADQGYIACENCFKNENAGVYLDCSHNKSVDQCQKEGKSELAYDEENLRILCRTCHCIHDKLY